MPPSTMPIVTQVAPYADGPAGVHGVLPQAATALAELARLANLEPLPVTDVADLDPPDLERARVLALFIIGETPFSAAQRAAITTRWRERRLGVLGVHSATDACNGWEEYGAILGGRFDGHPWTQDFLVEVVDGGHPATTHLGRRFPWRDEVYLFHSLRPDLRVLLEVADGQLDLSVAGARRPAHGFPLCWCTPEGSARSFYTALGHFPGAWETPPYLKHLYGGLSWLLEE